MRIIEYARKSGVLGGKCEKIYALLVMLQALAGPFYGLIFWPTGHRWGLSRCSSIIHGWSLLYMYITYSGGPHELTASTAMNGTSLSTGHLVAK